MHGKVVNHAYWECHQYPNQARSHNQHPSSHGIHSAFYGRQGPGVPMYHGHVPHPSDGAIIHPVPGHTGYTHPPTGFFSGNAEYRDFDSSCY